VEKCSQASLVASPVFANFEVWGSRRRLQIGKYPCTKWLLAIKFVGVVKKRQFLALGIGTLIEMAT